MDNRLSSLLKRLKKIEEDRGENDSDLHFEDGTVWHLTAKEWHSLWDLQNIKDNPIYKRMLKEWEKGNADVGGDIHVFNAYANAADVWADYQEEE